MHQPGEPRVLTQLLHYSLLHSQLLLQRRKSLFQQSSS